MLLCGLLALHLRAADRGCPSAPGLPCALFKRGGQWNAQNSGVQCRENADPCLLQQDEMVLPDRIELSTSPLPMECSTTELRQQCWGKNRPPQGPTKRADICHRPPRCASLQGRPKRENRDDIGDYTAVWPGNDRLSVDFGSASPTNWPVGRCGGFDPFWISHDRDHRGLLSCRNPWACYRHRCMDP